MKQVILARPNSFIVDEMKRLMQDGGYTPIPVSSLDELGRFDMNNVAGAVISTALTSTVKEDYHEVVKALKGIHSEIPIILATLIDFESVRRAVEIKFKTLNLDYRLLSVQLASSIRVIDPEKEILVIQKNDISDPSLYASTFTTVRKFFV